MTTLINRIQRAFLGSAGAEKVRALLAELAIPAGGSGENALREARRGFLRPISDEAILREALGSLGLTGGGTGVRPLTRVRSAILHNLIDSETTLRDGLNDLLEGGDLASGGGGAPAWVPENAVIHIDLLGGDPQGRAWVEGTGAVAVETLLGNDPIVDGAWGASAYDSSDLTVDGFETDQAVAFLGAARTKLLAGATVRIVNKNVNAGDLWLLVLTSEAGAEHIRVSASTSAVECSSNSGSVGVGQQAPGLDGSAGARNCIALTITDTRLEAACNGNGTLLVGIVDETDRPPGTPMVAALFDYLSAETAIQSITIYDPLSSTAGLSELSSA